MKSIFLSACRQESTPYTPIWLMRQAGRYMKEYRDVRDKVSFLELCKRPELASEVTIKAVEVLNVDAAIIFADILLITEPLGFKLTFGQGEGPKIHNPFRSDKDLKRLSTPNAKDSLSFVMEAIRQTRRALKREIPVIGFAGAPFTVASYAIEGGGSKSFENTKNLMRSNPALWNEFLGLLTSATVEYLNAQIEAGAEAIQLFDSWIGALNPFEYEAFVLPHVKELFSRITKGVPKIYFGTGTTAFLKAFASAGCDVVGVDFHIPLDRAWKEAGNVAIQGNLDPTVLFSPKSVIEREAGRILGEAAGRAGHIFNLGHGILPTTPVENAKHLVAWIHERSAK